MLFDSSRKDPGQPQYGWTEFCFSLGNAKRTAERLAQGYEASRGRVTPLSSIPPRPDHVVWDPFDPMDKAIHELGDEFLAQTEHIHGDWILLREYSLSPGLLQ